MSHPDPEVRRRAFERRLEIVRQAVSKVAGEPVTREDVIGYLQAEPDPQAEMDRLYQRAVRILADTLEVACTEDE